ncbi:hypothetical protein [Dyadobacter sp. 3J3]|uniref:hypothetical protein n=1 Tax=Dyadobacter sp. 3J3 TaxID=2606600 RepID=UPI00135B6C43|nr:hypothetical protein [Dyadobacter sp. 3J3]
MKTDKIYYHILKEQLKSQKASYEELLSTIDWQIFREKILRRDQYKCTNCEQEPTEYSYGQHFQKLTSEEKTQLIILNEIEYNSRKPDLIFKGRAIKHRKAIPITKKVDNAVVMHVHHKFYILDKLPWNYHVEDLTTLCNICHTDFHKNNKVPFYEDERKLIKLDLTECPRCNGEGHFDEFKHVYGGICFYCKGAKYIELMGSYR